MTARQKIDPVCTRLGITAEKTKRKAEELVRRLDLKAPMGIKSAANACKYAVCLHLACQMTEVAFDRNLAYQTTGVDSKVYRDAYKQVTSLLQIQPPVSLKELAEQYKCPQVGHLAATALTKYKRVFTESLPESRRQGVNFDCPSFPVAAFVLAAESLKMPVDEKTILELTDTRKSDFRSELIFPDIPEPSAKPTRSTRGRPSKIADVPRPSTKNEALIVTPQILAIDEGAFDQAISEASVAPKKAQSVAYKEWVEKSLSEPKGNVKQTRLNFQPQYKTKEEVKKKTNDEGKKVVKKHDTSCTLAAEEKKQTKRKRATESSSDSEGEEADTKPPDRKKLRK